MINELRIGNYISHTPSKNETTEAYFIVSDLRTFNENTINGINIEDCEPILISEKWLKDFGYIIIETNKCVEAFMKNLRYSIKKVENTNHWFWCDEEKVITNLEFIHELQNLHFALTRNELTKKNTTWD